VRPDTKVIYTSGSTQDLIAHRGVLHDDISYIPKPYTADQIAAKVREALGKD
jgi:two-component system cell cycle sensor histidine kinase/response regulator CckA